MPVVRPMPALLAVLARMGESMEKAHGLLTTKRGARMCRVACQQRPPSPVGGRRPLMYAIWADHLDLVRILRQRLRPREDGLELMMHIRQDLLSSEVAILGVRDAEQVSRIDFCDETKVIWVDDELAAVEAVLSEGISNVASDQPLGESEAVVAKAQDFSGRRAPSVTAREVLR